MAGAQAARIGLDAYERGKDRADREAAGEEYKSHKVDETATIGEEKAPGEGMVYDEDTGTYVPKYQNEDGSLTDAAKAQNSVDNGGTLTPALAQETSVVPDTPQTPKFEAGKHQYSYRGQNFDTRADADAAMREGRSQALADYWAGKGDADKADQIQRNAVGIKVAGLQLKGLQRTDKTATDLDAALTAAYDKYGADTSPEGQSALLEAQAAAYNAAKDPKTAHELATLARQNASGHFIKAVLSKDANRVAQIYNTGWANGHTVDPASAKFSDDGKTLSFVDGQGQALTVGRDDLLTAGLAHFDPTKSLDFYMKGKNLDEKLDAIKQRLDLKLTEQARQIQATRDNILLRSALRPQGLGAGTGTGSKKGKGAGGGEEGADFGKFGDLYKPLGEMFSAGVADADGKPILTPAEATSQAAANARRVATMNRGITPEEAVNVARDLTILNAGGKPTGATGIFKSDGQGNFVPTMTYRTNTGTVEYAIGAPVPSAQMRTAGKDDFKGFERPSDAQLLDGDRAWALSTYNELLQAEKELADPEKRALMVRARGQKFIDNLPGLLAKAKEEVDNYAYLDSEKDRTPSPKGGDQKPAEMTTRAGNMARSAGKTVGEAIQAGGNLRLAPFTVPGNIAKQHLKEAWDWWTAPERKQ